MDPAADSGFSLESLTPTLFIGSLILIVCVVAIRLSNRTGLPSLLIYLGVGLAIGETPSIPVEVHSAELTQALGYCALIVILAEGGLTTQWSSIRRSVVPAALLSTVGVLVSVVVVAVVFGRDRFSALRFAALPFAIGGVALTALGAGAGAVDGKGVLLALCSAFTYIGFSLHGDSLSVRADPFVLTALLATGSTASFVVYGLATGELHGPVTAVGLGWIATIACTSLLAYATFFIGIREAGPSLTALLAMLEPVFVLVVAGTVLGEHLVPLQLAGAGLVLASIVVVNAVELRRGGSRPA